MLGLGLRIGIGGFESASAPSTPWYESGKAGGVDPSFWVDFENDRYAVNGVVKSFSEIFLGWFGK